MVVRQDVAVGRQDKAGTGRGACGLVAEVVGGDGGRDADGGVDVLGVDLTRRQRLAGVDGRDLQGCGLALALEHDGSVGRGGGNGIGGGRGLLLHQRRCAEAGAAADQRACQQQRDDLRGLAALLLCFRCRRRRLLRSGLPGLLRGLLLGRLPGLLFGLLIFDRVGMDLMFRIEFFRHIDDLLFSCSGCAARLVLCFCAFSIPHNSEIILKNMRTNCKENMKEFQLPFRKEG